MTTAKIKFALCSLLAIFFMASGTVYAGSAGAVLNEACKEAPDSPICKQAEEQTQTGRDPIAGPGGILSKAINVLALVAGIAAVIIIILSGFVYATAGGAPGGQRAGDNPTRARKARSTLVGAAIGLIIVALAWSIARFIVDRIL